jgi:hypothetical protein
MTRPVPQEVVARIIAMYLRGLSEREIAKDTGVSLGAVSARINEWRAGKSPVYEDLRVFTKDVREACQWARAIKKRLGVYQLLISGAAPLGQEAREDPWL